MLAILVMLTLNLLYQKALQVFFLVSKRIWNDLKYVPGIYDNNKGFLSSLNYHSNKKRTSDKSGKILIHP